MKVTEEWNSVGEIIQGKNDSGPDKLGLKNGRQKSKRKKQSNQDTSETPNLRPSLRLIIH